MTTPNKRYPGRPNYTGPKSGFFLLPFHADLVMWRPDILARLVTIDRTKPQNEIAWRRHCIVYVRPKELPTVVVAAFVSVRKARAVSWKAHVAFCEVLIIHNKPLTALLDKFVPDHTWNGKELIFK